MRHFIFSLISFVLFAAPVWAAKYDKPYVGEMREMRAKYEDTFVHLALKHDLGYVEMRAANPLVDPWVPGAGTKLILPKRHLLPDAPYQGLVINLPEMRLYYFPKGGKEPKTFPIGVGREGLNTPTGKTKIVRKKEGPQWRPTDRMREEDPELPPVVEPGPENPLGSHALYLGWPEYLIHGTNRPFGIGRRISSGCIRLYPKNIIKLFDMVPVGTKVTVVDQPIKLAWISNRLYIEAHPNLEQSILMEERGEVKSKLSNADMERIKKFAGPYKDKIRWAAVRTAIRERRGYPIEIGRRSASAVKQQEAKKKEEKKSKAETAEKQASAAKKAKDVKPEAGEEEAETVQKNKYFEEDDRTAGWGLARPEEDIELAEDESEKEESVKKAKTE